MSLPDSSSSKANDYFLRLEIDGEDGGEYIDHWDTGELLFLASSVQKSSDRNWVSVARGLKVYGEQTRPSDFYTQKNCALQYSKLLSEVDEDSKKKSMPRTERETSEAMLVKNLTDKRLSELAWLNQQTKSAANVLKSYIDMVENGDLDNQLDDLLRNMEEKDRREEEKYVEYLSKREGLNGTKKLNKSRLAKGKSTKALDTKKKNSFSEMSEDSSSKGLVAEVVKNIKKEIEEEELLAAAGKHYLIKSEPASLDPKISLNALLDSKVTMPSSVPPTSPLLTSLLRTITSTSSSSPHLPPLSSSPLKDSDHGEGDLSKSEVDLAAFLKSKELSPRASVPQSPRGSIPHSPRPTPSSSPLLNSLLKNSPSSSLASKDVSPKTVSSPQPFFNPSNALAAAQQLAVATSSQSLSHQFFPHEANDSRKTFQSSPVTSSACLAAPTLSKLLEMPPSTPGRLPPLPVLDHPPHSSKASSPAKMASYQVQAGLKVKQEFSPSKTAGDKIPVSLQLVTQSQAPNLSSEIAEKVEIAEFDKASSLSSSVQPTIHIKEEPLDTSNDISLVEEISESNQSDIQPTDTETKLDIMQQELSSSIRPNSEKTDTVKADINSRKDDCTPKLISDIKIEELEDVKPDISMLGDDSTLISKVGSDDKETCRKIFKSRTAKKALSTEENLTQTEDQTVLLSPSKIKTEPESPGKKRKADPESPMVKMVSNFEIGEEESDSVLDTKSEKSDEIKSPICKKPKLFETVSPEKMDVSEDEMSIRRSGRKPKTGRGRGSKTPLSKPIDLKDQYEFSESAEENSVGYQTSNALCYGSRIKESLRHEEKTKFSSQDSDESLHVPNTDSSSAEKISPAKVKTESSERQTSGKSPFGTDDDLVSDSFTSDDASNSMLTEDKLKQWEESTESNSNNSKVSGNNKIVKPPKGDTFKKKPPLKRHQSSKNTTASKKERKLTGSDLDELSACSRDSDASTGWKKDKETSDHKDLKTNLPECKVEITDSRLPLSVATESEPVDDLESLQGSITADFSPPENNDVKDEKDVSQFGKQDWFHGVSPKSSERVSQSSEESEYESDNWDSHSVSTNKSASHSGDHPPRTKRKERETPEYKAWKKAIHIVLREASCHKYANVFLQKVTNDVAPGYCNIVHRPMDLSLIKKNIDNGTIRTTDEFHNNVLLMFQNAIMYNSSDHDVYKMAVEMQSDVIEQIEAFLTTQYNDKDEHNEPPSSLRVARVAKSQRGGGKQPAASGSSKTRDDMEKD